jgi:hypothetical protein
MISPFAKGEAFAFYKVQRISNPKRMLRPYALQIQLRTLQKFRSADPEKLP